MTYQKGKTRPGLAARVLTAIGLLVLATCSDDGGNPPGTLGEARGQASYSGMPLVGATVTVSVYYQNQETLTIATTTTDELGHWIADLTTYSGDLLVTVKGGQFQEAAGGTVTLDASATLHAPIQDLQPGERRASVIVSPLSELVWALGNARLAATPTPQDPDYATAIEHARALIAAHVGFDPLSTPIASLGAATPFNESARHALVLAGLSELMRTAATDRGVTVQAINTRTLLTQLVRDASSPEARLDGNGPGEVLSVGSSCPLPTGCSIEQLACYASCHVYTNTLRSRLAASILIWLLRNGPGDPNQTGLDKSDVLSWVTGLVDSNPEGMLFGDEAAERLDDLGPTITWIRPAADAVVTGTVTVELDAADTIGVAAIEVTAGTATPITLVDTDPRPEKFLATLDTVGLPDGDLTLTATATDDDDNATPSTRRVFTDNIDAGVVSGIAVKGALRLAPVTVYAFATGTPGDIVGTGMTEADGSFDNVQIAEGTNGPLLIEVGGGGTYVEEAFPNPTVTMDISDHLTTVVPAFTDGGAVSGVVVTPLTSLAVSYFSFLHDQELGGATLPARWGNATAAIEDQTGIADIEGVVPLTPLQMTTLTAGARYGLVLIGMSRIAWQAATGNGGDAGTFGVAVSAQRVSNAWSRDLADGCWDGRDGTEPLSYGGTQTFDDQATRLDLANAIVAYLTDTAHNPTPFLRAADVLPLLNTLATGGDNDADGACPEPSPGAGTHLFDDDGDTFDQLAPTITFRGMTPADGAFVKGSIIVDALAEDPDLVDTRPSLAFVLPTGVTDVDGDPTDPDAFATIDTTARPEGLLQVRLVAADDSGNSTADPGHDGVGERAFTVDNIPPVIAITSPATSGGFYQPGITVGYTVTESNLAAASATDNGLPIANGGAIFGDGPHTLVVTATDRAMTTVTATRTFTIDSVDPVLNLTAPADGAHVQGPVTLSWAIAEANPGATSAATLDGNPIPNGHLLNAEGPHTLVVNATDAAGNPAATITRTFTIDNTDPVLTVGAPAHGSYVQPPATITFSAIDTWSTFTITARLNGVPILSGHTPLPNATYTLVIDAIDQAGNAAPTVTRTFTVDNAAPTISVMAPAHGSYVQGPIMLAWSVSDGGNPATATATLDGDPIAMNPYTLNMEGLHTLVVNATDAAGNPAAPITRSFTIDNTRPTINLVAPAHGSYVRGNVTITFSPVDLNPATATATLDGNNFASGQPYSTPGTHTLIVNATDAAGNAAFTITRTFTIDNTPPTISLTAPAQGSFVQGPIKLAWSVSDSGNPGATATATLDGDPISMNPYTLNMEGLHTLVVTATDLAGNPATLTRSFTIDNTRPTITIGGVTDGASYPGPVTITYFASDNFPPVATVGALLNGVPHPSPGSVSAQGSYTLEVSATDRAGNNAIPVTISFLIDATPPTLSVTSQVPSGAYVRGTLALTVTGTDGALEMNGSLGPNITVSANQGPSTVTPTLSFPAAGSARQVVASFPQAILADGPLQVRFNLVDRAGNPAPMRTVNVTIDNTAPTGLSVTGIDTTAGAHSYLDTAVAPPHLWLDTTTPTLVGAFTEANPGASVTVTVGAQSVNGFITDATTWRGATPAGAVTTGGVDAVVTVTDAAGNFATVTRVLRYDDAAPIVTATTTQVRDEAGDLISFAAGTGARPSHSHGGTVVDLGSAPPPTCPTVSKYAYLTATAPVGLEPGGTNPISFRFRASDGGAGIDPATLTYTVTAPGGQVRGPFPVDTVAPQGGGLYEATAALHRDGVEKAIPELGVPGLVREGDFTFTFFARDRVARASQLGRCWNHRPLGPPVRLDTVAQQASNPLWSLASSLCAIAGGSSCLAALMNGNASAGMLELVVENTSGDPAYLTFTPSGPSFASYTSSWRTVLVYDHSIASTGPICNYDISTGDPAPGNDPMCDGAYSSTPDPITSGGGSISPTPAVEAWKFTSSSPIKQTPCAGCGANQYFVPPGDRWAALVSLTSLPGLRPPGLSGPYTVRGGLAGQFSTAPDLEVCEEFSSYPSTPSYTRTRCTLRAVHRQFRGLRAASLTSSAVVEMSWASRVAPAAASSSPASTAWPTSQRRILSYSWSTTE